MKKRYRLTNVLNFSYALMFLFLILITLIGLNGITKLSTSLSDTYNVHVMPMDHTVRFAVPYSNLRSAMRDIAIAQTAEDNERHKNTIENNFVILEDEIQRYLQLLMDNPDKVSTEEIEAVSAINDALVPYRNFVYNDLIPAAMANDQEKALSVVYVDLNNVGQIIRESLETLGNINTVSAYENAQNGRQTANSIYSLFILVFLTALLFSVTLSRFIIRAIKKSMKDLTKTSHDLSIGIFHATMPQGKFEEFNAFTNSMQKMSNVFQGLIQDLKDLANLHKQGITHARMDVTKYQGSYAEVGASINEMVTDYIHTYKMILDNLNSIADGDFSAEFKQFPGEMKVINETVERVQKSILSLSSEINTILEYALTGDITHRADASHYYGEWAEILIGLNRLLEAINEPIMESAAVLEEMSIGHFEKKINGVYHGVFGIIKESVNTALLQIASYTNEISDVVSAMSHNDLNQEIKRAYRGNFRTIKDALNSLITSYNEVIMLINTSSAKVLTGATNLNESSSVLAEGAIEQTATIQQLSASVAVISNEAQNNSKNAKNADTITKKSQDNVAQGNESMKRMLVSMSGISKASENISAISKVINDIAFQTNILALNASVEAARAGVHGKGFSVVAQEVGNLAAKTQKAALEIDGLITDAIDKTKEGEQTADETANRLQLILEDISEISAIVTSIVRDSDSQASAIAQMQIGMNQIAQVATKNSALSEESASASIEFSEEAERLSQITKEYRTKEYRTKEHQP